MKGEEGGEGGGEGEEGGGEGGGGGRGGEGRGRIGRAGAPSMHSGALSRQEEKRREEAVRTGVRSRLFQAGILPLAPIRTHACGHVRGQPQLGILKRKTRGLPGCSDSKKENKETEVALGWGWGVG